MSKTASAYGRLRRARFAYSPVLGDLKSGIPAAVESPAPVKTTIRDAFPSLISFATDSSVRDLRVRLGTLSSSSSCEFSWPILLRRPGLLDFEEAALESRSRRRLPMVAVVWRRYRR